MRSGKSWVTVDVYDENYDCELHEVLVKWEYDPHGGNEVISHWFDYQILLYPDVSDKVKEQIEIRLEEFDIEKIIISEED